MIYVGKSRESVPLARRVALGFEEGRNQVGRIWYQAGRVLVDGCNGEDGVLADICVAMLETRPRRREERLDQLWLAELAEKAQGVAPNVFVRVLEVVPDAVAAERKWSEELNSERIICASGLNTHGEDVRVAYQTRIISCLSFPPASSFGQIS